jgi:hypothetical protein
MTRDDIIRMAREAALYHFYDSEGHCTGITDARLVDEDKNRWDDRLVEMLAPFAALVAAAERERIIAQNAPEIEKINAHIKALEEAVAQRDALLRALRWIATVNAMDYEYQKVARAAIKAAEENK